MIYKNWMRVLFDIEMYILFFMGVWAAVTLLKRKNDK